MEKYDKWYSVQKYVRVNDKVNNPQIPEFDGMCKKIKTNVGVIIVATVHFREPSVQNVDYVHKCYKDLVLDCKCIVFNNP